MQKKKGVSLIVLVITVIVMVILAGTIILTINNTGIMGKAQSAVDETNLKEVQQLAELKWSEAFLDGNTSQENLEREVLARLQEEQIDLSKYIITVTDEGVSVDIIRPNPWIVATVDGVPIPKGFVASSATGENTKAGGLVIYEGTEPVTDSNVETAKRTRNQYVWVPVPKEDFRTKFIRQNFGESYKISGILGTGIWEVEVDEAINMPLVTQNLSQTTLKEVQAMYESVKANEGFYIGRYEAGKEYEKIYSVMGKEPYNRIYYSNGGSFDPDLIARGIYPETNENFGVVSTLTYGVQWDRTLAWWLESGAKDKDGKVITNLNSIDIGTELNPDASANIYRTVCDDIATCWYEGSGYFYITSLDEIEEVVADDEDYRSHGYTLTTGAIKGAKINNIYDMVGNMNEWTMERERQGGTDKHIWRDGVRRNWNMAPDTYFSVRR